LLEEHDFVEAIELNSRPHLLEAAIALSLRARVGFEHGVDVHAGETQIGVECHGVSRDDLRRRTQALEVEGGDRPRRRDAGEELRPILDLVVHVETGGSEELRDLLAAREQAAGIVEQRGQAGRARQLEARDAHERPAPHVADDGEVGR
jgi:hypothetical protein